MREKLDYIHYNPVKRGYVNLPEHWYYSSAGHYAGMAGVLEVAVWRWRRWSVWGGIPIYALEDTRSLGTM